MHFFSKMNKYVYLSTSEVSKLEPGVITAPGVVALRLSCSYSRDSPGPGPPGAVPEALRRGVCGCGAPPDSLVRVAVPL